MSLCPFDPGFCRGSARLLAVTVYLLSAALPSTLAVQGVITGPFVEGATDYKRQQVPGETFRHYLGPYKEGAGKYRLLPRGSFEVPEDQKETSHPLHALGWSVDPSSFVAWPEPTSDRAFEGDTAVIGPVYRGRWRRDPDFELSVYRRASVKPGQSYVVSAFVYAGDFSGTLRLNADGEVNDMPEVVIPADVPAWQFVWVPLEIPENGTSDEETIRIQIILEGLPTIKNPVYVDGVALTPADAFVPPTPLPSKAPSLEPKNIPGFWIEGTVGRPYRIEVSARLDRPEWEYLTTITLPESPYLFVDSRGIGQPRRFYRAVPVDPVQSEQGTSIPEQRLE